MGVCSADAAVDGGTWHCKVMCEWQHGSRSSGGSAHCIDVHLIADWALRPHGNEVPCALWYQEQDTSLESKLLVED